MIYIPIRSLEKKNQWLGFFPPLFCRHCNTIISARIFSVQINLWLTFSSHDWWCLVDVNKRKYPCIVALSLSVVYHSRCNLKTRSMMLMLLWSTFFFFFLYVTLFSQLLEQSVSIVQRRKEEVGWHGQLTEETEKEMVTSLSLEVMKEPDRRKKERTRKNDTTIVMLSKYIKRLIDINQSMTMDSY